MHHAWKLALLVSLLPVGLTQGAVPDVPGAAPPVDGRATQFDDPLEPFVPLVNRSEREEDHLRALALFAGGRVAEQKQDFARALFCYQRAFRLDPDSLTVLREIVPLAFNLDRQAEAVRYALIIAERDPTDPVLLRRLAIYLSETGEMSKALAMYEQALAAQAKSNSPANAVLLHMELGRLYFIDKQYEQAALHFEQVLTGLDNPQEAGVDANLRRAILGRPEVTYQLFGEAFLETNRLALAATTFDKVNEAKPEEAVQAYNQARVLFKQKQQEQALAKLQIYFDKHQASRGTGPYQLLADVLAEQSPAGEAIERLAKLREQDPTNIPLGYFLAGRYRAAGQADRAVAIYQDLIDRNKTRPPLEAYGGLLDIYREQKDSPHLLATLGDAMGRGGSIDVLGESGRTLIADKVLVQNLLGIAREQLANAPDTLSPGAKLAAAHLAIEAEDFAGANLFFEQALKAEPNRAPEILVSWGLELFMAHQYAEAAKVFQRGLDEKVLPESNPALHFYLGGALEMTGRTDEAVAAARAAADRQPENARFQARPAWIQYHAKRYDAARRDYLTVLEKFNKVQEPADVRESLREARLTLSNIAVIQGDVPQAEEWLEQVLDEFPDDTGALNDLGYLWADTNHHLERALDMTKKAVEREPKNHAYRDSLGWALYRLGRFTPAVEELRKATDEDEPDGVVLDHLADALSAAGQPAEAAQVWQRALKAFEKQSEPEKAEAVRKKLLQPPLVPAAH